MKLECQSCLLQFDAVGPGPGVTCPRCGSSNLINAPGNAAGPPPAGSSTASSSAGIAATIAQPMQAPMGSPSPFGAAPQPAMPQPPSPFGAQPQAPQQGYGQAQGYGQPAPFGQPPQVMGGYGAPQQQPQQMYGAPQQQGFQQPYGYAPQQQQGGFGPAPAMGFGIAPMQQMGGYGNPQAEAEQRKAMILGVIGILGIWPLGLFAIMTANQARDALVRGDVALSLSKSKSAQIMGWISVAVLGLVVIGGCLIGLAGAA